MCLRKEAGVGGKDDGDDRCLRLSCISSAWVFVWRKMSIVGIVRLLKKEAGLSH